MKLPESLKMKNKIYLGLLYDIYWLKNTAFSTQKNNNQDHHNDRLIEIFYQRKILGRTHRESAALYNISTARSQQIFRKINGLIYYTEIHKNTEIMRVRAEKLCEILTILEETNE